MKTGLMYGIVTDANSQTRVRCVFCGVYIPKATKCIEQHTNGTRHKDNIELMAENGIIFKNEEGNEVLFCRPCKHTLANDESVSKHIEGDNHATWLTAIEDLVEEEFINLEPYLSSTTENVTCEACNETIECTLQKIEEHVNSFDHRVKVCDKLKPLNGIFPVENNDEMWCKICNLHIENTVQSILKHIDDYDNHINRISDLEELIMDQGISIAEYLANEHEQNAYCNTCKTEILCNTQSIEEHINSETHLNNLIKDAA